MTQSWHNGLALLLAAILSGPVMAAAKSSDLVTCTVAAATDTFEFGRGFLQPAEYARFGLILCKPRREARSDVWLELSAHGPLTVGFFLLPRGPGAPQQSGESTADPAVMAKRLGLREETDWNGLFDELRKQGKLSTVAGEKIVVGGELWFGYVASLRADRLLKTEADIMYSAGAMEIEKLMTVSLERSLSEWEKFVDGAPTFLTTFVTNLLGVVVGAGLSYFFFHRQQRVLADLEERKLFRQRKLEKAGELLVFFRDDYADLSTKLDDAQKVQNVRRALVLKGIYSMLPLDVMDKLNTICDDKGPLPAPRGKMLDDLLRENFRELMVSS